MLKIFVKKCCFAVIVWGGRPSKTIHQSADICDLAVGVSPPIHAPDAFDARFEILLTVVVALTRRCGRTVKLAVALDTENVFSVLAYRDVDTVAADTHLRVNVVVLRAQ